MTFLRQVFIVLCIIVMVSNGNLSSFVVQKFDFNFCINLSMIGRWDYKDHNRSYVIRMVSRFCRFHVRDIQAGDLRCHSEWSIWLGFFSFWFKCYFEKWRPIIVCGEVPTHLQIFSPYQIFIPSLFIIIIIVSMIIFQYLMFCTSTYSTRGISIK